MIFLLMLQAALADAICRDGWRSSSTGSGTCSHHGGVAYWIPSTNSPTSAPTGQYQYRPRYPTYNFGPFHDRILDIYSGVDPDLYLGCLTCDPNHDDPEIRNKSIRLAHGRYYMNGTMTWGSYLTGYASNFEDYSACSPKAKNPPKVFDRYTNEYIGRLSVNMNLPDTIKVLEVIGLVNKYCQERT